MIVFFLLMTPFITFTQNLSANTTGLFTYIPEVPLNNKNIRVFYHIPNGDISKMPILFSFHGANRNAEDYRDYWVSMANANGFMVFSPEFSSSNFSGGDAYNLANIFVDGDNPSPQTFNPQNEWTFSIIDPLFEYIKSDISGTQEKYNAWGHSAGSQFLQRFVLYLPESKLDIAVCSNAGWYTVPENSVDFPYGINKGQLPNTNIEKAFAKKVYVHLGKNDNNPNASGLRRNAVVDAQQGTHRLERGQYFFNTSKAVSQNLNYTFHWEKIEVNNVAHNAQQMANSALQYILQNNLSVSDEIKPEEILIYPNPVKDKLIIQSNKDLGILKIFSIHGKLIKSFQNKKEISVKNLSSGIYILHVNNQLIKFIIQ